MDALLGLTGKGFTLIAASKAAISRTIALNDTDDKIRDLNKYTMMGNQGEPGDVDSFADTIRGNIQWDVMLHDTQLGPDAVASFLRSFLAESLRSRNHYYVQTLLGGVDPVSYEPSLFWIDYLATKVAVPYAMHGYVQLYCQSIFDKYYRKDLTEQSALNILRKCTEELQRRMILDFKGFTVKIIDKDGIRVIDYDDDNVIKCA